MSTDIDYFPRGPVKSSTTTKSNRFSQKSIDRNDLFLTSSSNKRKRSSNDKKKTEREQKKKKKKSIDGEDLKGNIYRRLHKQNLTDGILMLGCIEKISSYELRVSLPHQNIGFVPMTMISNEFTQIVQEKLASNPVDADQEDDLEKLFHLGQYVLCRVIESVSKEDNGKQQKRLHLSINPKDVCDQITPDHLVKGMLLPGVISSIEDHGFIIDVGFSQRKGFVRKEKNSEQNQYKIGYHGLFQVKDSTSAASRIITLKFIDPTKELKALSPKNLPFHMLIPGQHCRVTVTKARVNGLEVSFGEVKGFVHLQDLESFKDSAEKYSPEQELETCVLAVDPTTKSVHFSMQKHFLALNKAPSIVEHLTGSTVDPDHKPVLGSVQSCMVVKNIGSSLAVRLPKLQQFGLVASTHLTDEKDQDIQELLNSFKPNEKRQCRVIGISLSSNLAICSFKKSVIEAPFITYADIQVGSMVKGSITHVDQNGLSINLTKHINGFVPPIHNADIPIKETLNKFSLKKKIQCRVLSVDPMRQRLILTMKKSLINSKLPIVTSFSDLRNNMMTIGVVNSIQEYGLLIKLFGDLCGLVPKTEIGQLQNLSTTNIKSQLQQMFYVGQTVECKVLNSNEQEKKITLSLKVPGRATFGSKLAAVPDSFSIGQVVQWTVTDADNDEHLEGFVMVERRRKTVLPVTLTRNHISDFVEHQSLLMRFDLAKNKTQQHEAIYWSHLSYINISMRKILVEFCRRSTIPKKFEDCTIGSIVPGVVQNIFSYGLFIDLPNNIVGFAPHKHLNITGSFGNIETSYRVGQSLLVRILQLDNEKNRCIVTLKSILYDGEIAELFQPEYVLRQYLDEKNQIIEAMKTSGTGPLSKFFKETEKWIGMRCRCLIENKSDNWFVGRLENGLPAIVPYDAHYSIGSSVEGSIIDFHLPGQQLVLLTDMKTSISSEINSLNSIKKCRVLCRLPVYTLALTEETNRLLHFPNFTNLNSFHSNSSLKMLKEQQEISLEDTTPYYSERYNYLIVSLPKKKPTIRIHQANEKVSVTVVDVLQKQINVKLSDGSRGRIHIVESMENDDLENLKSLTDHFRINQTLSARILGTRNIEPNEKHHRPVYELSLREKSVEQLNIFDRVVAFVDKVDEKSKGYWFSLSAQLHGYLPLELVSKRLNVGQFYPVNIMAKAKNDKGDYFSLSMFTEQQNSSNFVYAKFKEIHSANEFHFVVEKDQQEYLGILMSTDVADIYENFVFWSYLMNVKMPSIINGHVNMKKESWKFRNRAIRAFVKHEDSEKKQMILSTRKSRLDKNHLDVIDDEIESIEQVAVGDVLHGYIDRLTNRQIDVLLSSERTVVGHIEKVHNRTLNGHLREFLDVGMVVEVNVLSVDQEKKKIQMKLTSEFIEELLSKRSKRMRLSRASSVNGSILGDEKTDDDFSNEPNAKRSKLDSSSNENKILGSDVKFDWAADLSTLLPTESEEQDEPIDFSSLKLRKNLVLPTESKSNSNKKSQEEFEELLKKASNDSQLWIEYMQFYIDQAETDRARAVAERALINIFYREERDKLNVWIAYLSLENRFGTPEKVNTILTRALGNCDGVQVYQRLACEVYEKNEQFDDANATFSLLIKKFHKDKQAWLQYLMYLFRRKQNDLAKTILDKSFSSLPEADHVEMINKFGQLEFKYGDQERAKTLYENLLSNYPKRTDLWSIYIDMIIKYDQQPTISARAIFDRVLSLNIPTKKMKFLIKKYLQFEKQFGTEEDLKLAKQRITHYINETDPTVVDHQDNLNV